MGKLGEGQQMFTVRVNNLVVRLHLVEMKDWSSQKATSLRSGTLNIAMTVVRTAQGTTSRVLGEQRATALFTLPHLPIEEDNVTQKLIPQPTGKEMTAIKDQAEPLRVAQPKVVALHDASVEGAIAG